MTNHQTPILICSWTACFASGRRPQQSSILNPVVGLLAFSTVSNHRLRLLRLLPKTTA
jgi:hypothetical protein